MKKIPIILSIVLGILCIIFIPFSYSLYTENIDLNNKLNEANANYEELETKFSEREDELRVGTLKSYKDYVENDADWVELVIYMAAEWAGEEPYSLVTDLKEMKQNSIKNIEKAIDNPTDENIALAIDAINEWSETTTSWYNDLKDYLR